TSYPQDTENESMKTKISKITLTNYRIALAKEKQNLAYKKICYKPKSTNNNDTSNDQKNDNQTKRRARTPIPVNNDDVTVLTRKKTKVLTLVNNTLITQLTIPKSD
ncbi:1309_t:CDS:2, partial [Gigaspora margarita]